LFKTATYYRKLILLLHGSAYLNETKMLISDCIVSLFLALHTHNYWMFAFAIRRNKKKKDTKTFKKIMHIILNIQLNIMQVCRVPSLLSIPYCRMTRRALEFKMASLKCVSAWIRTCVMHDPLHLAINQYWV
jgi:hypothetical protein